MKVGDSVKWRTSRKPLGEIIKTFLHKGLDYAVVESTSGVLKVVRVYEELEIVKESHVTK